MVRSAHGQLTLKRSHRLARRKTFESLRAQTRRMVSAANSPSTGREQGSGKPVDEAGSRRRGSRGSKAPTCPRSATAPERGAADEATRASGARSRGSRFPGEVWTCERVAELIRREFGVSYHRAHVSRLLKALRQSLQKPQRRANQRDEEAIEHWKEKRWPSLKKGH